MNTLNRDIDITEEDVKWVNEQKELRRNLITLIYKNQFQKRENYLEFDEKIKTDKEFACALEYLSMKGFINRNGETKFSITIEGIEFYESYVLVFGE
ncbi:hypothetical protein HXV90_06375 [Lysinibacillus sp. JK80]|uniref:hypothetical protein n=1 Tax=Lysinibacillus sp. JK80 TaxID=2749809 RepID=UPI0022B979F1|nr:hypothetical protein [Lysinibacillus sp. JK80]WBF55499.1 hypothetical protein HXV90_06375 [Lysinibacillus sp. JK80]